MPAYFLLSVLNIFYFSSSSEGIAIKSCASLVYLFVRRYHTSVSHLNTQLGALRNAWGLLEGTENHLPVCLQQQCAASHKLFVYPSAPSLRMGLREEIRNPRQLTKSNPAITLGHLTVTIYTVLGCLFCGSVEGLHQTQIGHTLVSLPANGRWFTHAHVPLLRTLLIPCLSSRLPFLVHLHIRGSSHKDHPVTILLPILQGRYPLGTLRPQPAHCLANHRPKYLSLRVNGPSVLIVYFLCLSESVCSQEACSIKRNKGAKRKRLTNGIHGWFLSPSGWL